MMSGMVFRTPDAARTVLTTLAACLAISLGSGCQPATPSEDPDADTDSAALRVQVVSGAEDLDEAARTEIEGSIGDVLSGYVVAAFLGDFPREEFVQSFESFTSGAARSAARDIAQLTAAGAQDATSVRATRLDARISVLSQDQAALGATAAVSLAFEATMPDGATRPLTLKGRFLLEEDDGDWSVFGYDVAMDDGDVVRAGSTS
ncbi:hypothetical protein EXE58_01535 [Nocardioides seonyuensis]|uniref:Nuclear transport factor 2 family protein n=1 Tax=Nocardioides seonyuensis TaxID=2518371 RepID=A0A4P7ICG4_9ACTN|nr:hypothetical protein [Nocardioides seonyuensis]QBX54280.1 hypothetical protein EXE58_01535 [Nocardioides seonyuensis]